MATSSSSVPFFGIRDEDQNPMKQQHSSTPTSSSAQAQAQPAQKKRRNQPDPDAEVIALSPKTLMATNRFICEVCNKGFQREQNLQLHRRGHNLPWKLKQKTTKEVRRKVYLCPEPTCVHHEPSRALGDLTGIKKHYSRKHGEKKWKCEKCSKRYAVQSDWKAHSKTCGTREYRCDCGTLFSRRDSFITHRAFCDALAQESARNPASTLNTIGSHLYGSSSNMSLGLSQVGTQLSSMQDQSTDILRLGGAGRTGQFDHLLPPSMGGGSASFRPPPPPQPPQSMPSPAFFMQEPNQNYHDEHQLQNKPFHHGLMQFADLHSAASPNPPGSNMFNLSFLSNSSTTSSNITNSNNSNNNLLMSNHFANQNGATAGGGDGSSMFSMGDHHHHQMNSGHVPSLFTSSVQNENIVPHMSATALLQKAAQMGSTSSTNSASLLRSFGSSSSSSGMKSAAAAAAAANYGGMFNEADQNNLHDLMNSYAGNSSIFGHGQENPYNGGNLEEPKMHQGLNVSMGGSDRLTRDFLGVGQIVRSMSGGFSQRDKQQQPPQQQQQHGIDMGGSSLESERNMAAAAATAAPTGGSFVGSGGFQ
ncbi:protein indeterminate-domain 5, chloroplastic isoform X2 [Mercurialis annua]|uniref:protein indeterminate-domain 5, chloroplastic isoform X2 n=1 Tax=Mercurialis annua TaxID=3986 RepID=UPI00215FB83E|nr:protein indeterminate-domain 5, chloroplastic isoform X2 [Mercurialis annua]